jgi:HAD superfamily hydrolase (TIGR01509 family)
VSQADPPSAVVFDNDGLLLDTEVAWTRAEQILFRSRGCTFTTEHKRSLIGSSRAQAARKLEVMLDLAGSGEQLMDELHELVMNEVLGGVPPRPGALELIAKLDAAGRPLAVASNSKRDFLERTLSGAGLLAGGPFASIVCAEDVPNPKPEPDIYLEACSRLGFEPQHCAALEDSPIGVVSAAAARMFVVGVPYLPGSELPGSHVLAESLADPIVAQALGLEERAEAGAVRGFSPPP